MKSILIAVAITLGFYTTNAQEFNTTERYSLVNQRSVGNENEGAGLIDIVASNNTINTIATLGITEIELLETVIVTVLPNPGLEDIAEILKVELEYAACCSSVDTFYFLVSVTNEFTALPHINNLYCEAPEFHSRYIFPNQDNGIEGTIVRAEIQYDQKNVTKEIKLLQSFVWNDDDFEQDTEIATY